jgi:hypothetical protein
MKILQKRERVTPPKHIAMEAVTCLCSGGKRGEGASTSDSTSEEALHSEANNLE